MKVKNLFAEVLGNASIIPILRLGCGVLIKWRESECFGFEVVPGRCLFVLVDGLKSRFRSSDLKVGWWKVCRWARQIVMLVLFVSLAAACGQATVSPSPGDSVGNVINILASDIQSSSGFRAMSFQRGWRESRGKFSL